MTTAEKLRQQGRQEGLQQGRIELVRKQLTLKFGALPDSALQSLNTASEAELDRYAERVLSANALEGVFD